MAIGKRDSGDGGAERGVRPETDGLAAAVAGRAQRGLDLSLGHFGNEPEGSLEVQDFGPFRVVFDVKSRQLTVLTNASAFASRAERRSAEREFRKIVFRVSRETGFDVLEASEPHLMRVARHVAAQKETPAGVTSTSGVVTNVEESNVDGTHCRP